jgi:hypothetical protein
MLVKAIYNSATKSEYISKSANRLEIVICAAHSKFPVDSCMMLSLLSSTVGAKRFARGPMDVFMTSGSISGLPSDWSCPEHARTLSALVEQAIRISGGGTEPSTFQNDYLDWAATCIENAAVPLNGRWISYHCTMSAWQPEVESTLNL